MRDRGDELLAVLFSVVLMKVIDVVADAKEDVMKSFMQVVAYVNDKMIVARNRILYRVIKGCENSSTNY